MNKSGKSTASSFKFYGLLIALSIPFWMAGMFIDGFLPGNIPINLPFSALVFVCPAAAALIVSWQGNRTSSSMIGLLRRSLKVIKPGKRIWYLPALGFWLVMMVLEYLWMKNSGISLPALRYPGWLVPLSFIAFLIGALGEEMGWLGYAVELLQARWGALAAGTMMGLMRAVWHIVPFIQTGNSAVWILWQSLSMLPMHILMVWLYNGSGKNVLAGILFHATYNLTSMVFPNYGFIYDPVIISVLSMLAVLIVIIFWDTRTLSRCRFIYDV